MNKDINLKNNNIQNGYIYEKLIERIDKLDRQNKEILSLIATAKDDMKISVKDYLSIIKMIEKCITREEFEIHSEDKEIHLHKSKTLEGEEVKKE